MTLPLVAVFLLTVFIIFFNGHAGGDGRRRRLAPSPRGLPVLGHLHLLGSLPHGALRSLSLAHGPVMLLRLGRVPTVVVSSAAGAEEVMRARDLAFASRPRSAMADRLLYDSRDVAFAPYGEYWRQARRVCALHLLSGRRVRSFRRVREQEGRRAGRPRRGRSRRRRAARPERAPHRVRQRRRVLSRVRRRERPRHVRRRPGREQVRKVLTDFQTLLGTQPVGELLPWLGWVDVVRRLEGKVRRTFEALDGLLDKMIDDYRRQPSNGDRRDFVDVLLDVRNHEKEHGIELETNEIKAFILARTPPPLTTVMEWAMAELVTHPRAGRKLQDEIRAAVGSTTGSVVGEGHVAQLDYLKAVVKKTLRLHAPLALVVPREPPADAEILGYHIPVGTRVVINAWAIGRDTTTWEDAEEFVPERFSGSAVDFRGQHFELVPFGAGRRGCPGLGLAEASIEMALASLMYHFDWESAGGTGPSALDMTEMKGISVHIKSALQLVAKPWIT
ncbi:hypothetical protein SETIT_5G248700v2 [Setaria italica]|uniref:Cytochrome P450 71A1 n=1 Tax=Setaria italica TaxID=4555 RepID=K3XQ34_SETIT|nr:hypothetical protein SETIT_5G248700v2 [Setaria italica]